jgi:hypothetical protein
MRLTLCGEYAREDPMTFPLPAPTVPSFAKGRAAFVVLSVLGGAVACGSERSPAQGPPTSATTDSGANVNGGATTVFPNTDGSPAFGAVYDAAACSANSVDHASGCSCAQADRTASCWTGSPEQRHLGKCHDGTQVCAGHGEFLTWGPCSGEEHDCGEVDAGKPAPDGGCGCVPGAVIECDEDCAVGLFCSITASKTCQPDGTWGPCRETGSPGVISIGGLLGDSGLGGLAAAAFCPGDSGLVPISSPGLPGDTACRNVYHGCCPSSESAYEGMYTGDCSSKFTCGHPPSN